MSSDDQLPDVPALRVLEPPPGGLAALRGRLDDEARPRRWWLAAIPLAALAVLALVIVRWPRAQPEIFDEPTPATAALADPEIGGGDVAFYWVASTPGGQNARTRAPGPEPVATISIDDAPRVTVVAQP
jgi:hypothetical protein